MIQTKTVTIDRIEYELSQLPAIEGRKIWRRILVAISSVVRGLSKTGALDESAMAGALCDLVENVDEETFEVLCKAFQARTRVKVDGSFVNLSDALFDMHFAGNYVAMMKWMGESAMFNFAGFTGAASLGTLLAKAQTMAAQAVPSRSKSPKDATGSSGASSLPTG